jgi:hypothetical protein
MTEEQMPRIQESDAIARYVQKKTPMHFSAQDFSVRFSLNVKTTRPQSFVTVGFLTYPHRHTLPKSIGSFLIQVLFYVPFSRCAFSAPFFAH